MHEISRIKVQMLQVLGQSVAQETLPPRMACRLSDASKMRWALVVE